MISAASTGAVSGKAGVALLLLGGAIGLCLLWALVVYVHGRRQEGIDLVELEAKIQAKRAKKAGYQVKGATDPELTSAQRAWSRTNEGLPDGTYLPDPPRR